jgi:hypothetical protein
MIMPPLQGNLSCNNFFLYAACDRNYFNEYALPFINSAKLNSGCEVHLHIFNPSEDQLNLCKEKNISYSYEYVDSNNFTKAANRWSVEPKTHKEKLNYDRILTAMKKSNDLSVLDRIQKTYYACARFVRLQELLKSNSKFFAVDIDAVVRKSIPNINGVNEIYMHKIVGAKARILAGGLYCVNSQNKFLTEYSNILKDHINKDNMHWGLDQDVLFDIVEKYNIGNLSKSYIDWDMRQDSIIWTAKGSRKELDIFISEQKKYTI